MQRYENDRNISFTFDPRDMMLAVQIGLAGPRSAVGSASDSKARGPGFDTRSDHLISFLLPLIQEQKLSATGGSR